MLARERKCGSVRLLKCGDEDYLELIRCRCGLPSVYLLIGGGWRVEVVWTASDSGDQLREKVQEIEKTFEKIWADGRVGVGCQEAGRLWRSIEE